MKVSKSRGPGLESHRHRFKYWASSFKRWFLYSAVSSPLDRSKRFTLFALPGRPVHSDTNAASPGSILAMQQLRAKAKSLTFPPLSIARHSFMQLRERKCPIFETVTKGDSNPGSLDCESGILPLSYRAPRCRSLFNFNLVQRALALEDYALALGVGGGGVVSRKKGARIIGGRKERREKSKIINKELTGRVSQGRF